ncbi:BTAD domain-containing putative transcriptional regulator [Amycolatopsis sp., V23-08]|uniref:BTAD domain-containing putative transcriptional regulator n=1 Tax=Amycolatopsis heterodermiae TaxID=3110235 RepID=A0ABU5RFX3_9PSEU|nr:BTAD domain-containing putative transcriptional regulator [Amycolatopsis sp., V23-08]MEA5364480.1 BTAD domain-containing putative transcriptional regulator [Amycolatopsis sp., V23-08]
MAASKAVSVNDQEPNVDIRLFGACELHVDGEVYIFNGEKETKLLVGLAIVKGQKVSRERLRDVIWDDPEHSDDDLSHLMRLLRGHLKDFGLPAVLPRPRDGVCQLLVKPTSVDLHRFDEQLKKAKATRSAEDYRSALGLFAGEPFAGVKGRTIDSLRARWTGEYGIAKKELVEIEMKNKNYANALVDLAEMHHNDPTNEPVSYQYMFALAKLGEVDNALDVYNEFALEMRKKRRPISSELGALRDQITQGLVRSEIPPACENEYHTREETASSAHNAYDEQDTSRTTTGIKFAAGPGSLALENLVYQPPDPSAVQNTKTTGPKVSRDGGITIENVIDYRK